MKTVINKTNAPIRVPLSRGKALHLGPRKSGQVRDEDAEHARLKKLVETGTIEIFDGGTRGIATGSEAAPHETTHGLGRSAFRVRKIGGSS